jgi:hypothetical protein
MRKAFSLSELLIVIATVPIFMFVMSRLFFTLMKDTPRIWKNVQQSSTLNNMLSQIQSDIDKATDLPQSHGDLITGDTLILIQQEDKLICYELDNQKATRKFLSETNTTEPRIWLIPDVKIEWNILRKNGKGYCLELQNYIGYKTSSRYEKKYPNSHLYFIGAM